MLEQRNQDFHNRLAYLMNVDPTFAEDLADSYKAVMRAIFLFGEEGYKVMLPPITINEGGDDGDFFVLMPVSIKHLTREFNSLESYPFDTVFVGTVSSTDAMLPGPWMTMCFNPDLSGAIIISGTSRPHWTIVERTSRGRMRKFYQVHKKHCHYRSFKNQNAM